MKREIYSPTSIKKILQEFGKPVKKSLGQNYLIDPSVPNKITALVKGLLQRQPEAKVFEIGPGLGSLTYALLKEGVQVTAIETDDLSVSILEDQFEEEIAADQLNIISADFLELEKLPIDSSEIILVGNLPYQITSPILFRCMEVLAPQLKHLIFMMQKEVAARLISPPDSRVYGKLSVFCQYYFESVKKVVSVSPGHFYPPPKVYSEVLHFKFREQFSFVENMHTFKMMIKSAFVQRRKKVGKAIATSSLYDFSLDRLENCWKVFPHLKDKRAENLTAIDFVHLSNLYEKKKEDQSEDRRI